MKKTVKTNKGTFEILANHRDSMDIDVFEERYIEEVHNKYTYFLCDYSAGILRIKGFYEARFPNYENIPDFIQESCAHGCPYYILKRIKKEHQDG